MHKHIHTQKKYVYLLIHFEFSRFYLLILQMEKQNMESTLRIVLCSTLSFSPSTHRCRIRLIQFNLSKCIFPCHASLLAKWKTFEREKKFKHFVTQKKVQNGALPIRFANISYIPDFKPLTFSFLLSMQCNIEFPYISELDNIIWNITIFYGKIIWTMDLCH